MSIGELFQTSDGTLERPRKCLVSRGIHTVGQLIELEEDDLLAIANFGQKSLDVVRERLANFDLELKGG